MEESEASLAKLQTQWGLFTKLGKPRDAAVKRSYVLSHGITRKSKWRVYQGVFGGFCSTNMPTIKRKHLIIFPSPEAL